MSLIGRGCESREIDSVASHLGIDGCAAVSVLLLGAAWGNSRSRYVVHDLRPQTVNALAATFPNLRALDIFGLMHSRSLVVIISCMRHSCSTLIQDTRLVTMERRQLASYTAYSILPFGVREVCLRCGDVVTFPLVSVVFLCRVVMMVRRNVIKLFVCMRVSIL